MGRARSQRQQIRGFPKRRFAPPSFQTDLTKQVLTPPDDVGIHSGGVQSSHRLVRIGVMMSLEQCLAKKKGSERGKWIPGLHRGDYVEDSIGFFQNTDDLGPICLGGVGY